MIRMLLFSGALSAFTVWAGAATGAVTNAPSATQPVSPVAYFRSLLAMTESERTAALAGRPEAQRTALMAKITEYAGMTATERELRLRVTELRYYLLPLMQLPPEERAERLKLVPDDIRDLVEDRLAQWDMIPPIFRDQLIENQATLQMFSRMNPNTAANADELIGPLPTDRVAEMGADFNRWQTLSASERTQLLKGFNHFFELTDAERDKTLRTLSTAERSAMEKTLKQFEQLPPERRTACIQAFQKFALLPPGEQARFLRNADRWQVMSPEDRKEWRSVVDLLSQVQMPPLPPDVEPVFVPDTPPLPPGFVPPGVAQTN